jgi:hypothetical protein
MTGRREGVERARNCEVSRAVDRGGKDYHFHIVSILVHVLWVGRGLQVSVIRN